MMNYRDHLILKALTILLEKHSRDHLILKALTILLEEHSEDVEAQDVRQWILNYLTPSEEKE